MKIFFETVIKLVIIVTNLAIILAAIPLR